jgi:hypothetical protein
LVKNGCIIVEAPFGIKVVIGAGELADAVALHFLSDVFSIKPVAVYAYMVEQ